MSKLHMIAKAAHPSGPTLHLARDNATGDLLLGIQLDKDGDYGVRLRIPEELLMPNSIESERHKALILQAIRDDVTRQLAILALEHKEEPEWPKRIYP